ncbi:MAG: NAD(P)-binding domain-containing protein [Dehalococcoidia bacterium]
MASAPAIFEDWVRRFADVVRSADVEGIGALLVADSWWRDLLALRWEFCTLHGVGQITDALRRSLTEHPLTDIRVHTEVAARPAEFGDRVWVEGFFDFRTPLGTGRGVVRLVEDPDGRWRAWTVFTALQELDGLERSLGPRRPMGPEHLYGAHRRESWLDSRIATTSFKHREPQVVIIGAGQGGLAVAANLELMGIDTLAIERNARVGDNWRKRYHSLVLHDPVWANHLPYLPFPASWPVYMSKDKIADWFEFYASTMELNVWTSTELVGSDYDDESGTWTVRLRTKGGERELHPQHLVLATGASGEPNIPDVPGREEFHGVVYHSSEHQSGERMRGRKAVVIGACNSAHDIAQDLYEAGAKVTMVQRSSTYIISQRHGIPIIFGGLYYEDGLPTEYADLLNAATPWPIVQEFARGNTERIRQIDRALLDRLEKVGFKLNFGVDGGGLMSHAIRTQGGYYVDVGCSELVATRKIAVAQGAGVASFTPSGVALTDGRNLDADLVVFATGYTNMRDTAPRLFGDRIADRCRPALGLDELHEINTLWRDSGQPGLWFMGGPLAWTRIYSQYLALQIAAIQAGLRPGTLEPG